MTINIKIKLTGLKGTSFRLSEKEKNILAGMLSFALQIKGSIISESNLQSYISMVRKDRGEAITPEVNNALYYLSEIAKHPYSFEIKEVKIS